MLSRLHTQAGAPGTGAGSVTLMIKQLAKKLSG
jgi:hypothetical protein